MPPPFGRGVGELPEGCWVPGGSDLLGQGQVSLNQSYETGYSLSWGWLTDLLMVFVYLERLAYSPRYIWPTQ